jgi:DNA-binding GntR family transcriptional regulator
MQYDFGKDRRNISRDLESLIREMIVDGRLAPGSRINEVHLAANLGVSRTPLREALAGLGAEEAVTAVPRRGFFVRDLTSEEVTHIYPIRALLDPEALRLSGIPPASRLETLRDLAICLRRAQTVQEAVQLDDDWHRTLWATCPNSVLIQMIEQFMIRTRRYELAAMRDGPAVAQSSKSKEEIIIHLEQGRLKAACSRLRRSLNDGAKPVLKWLETRG